MTPFPLFDTPLWGVLLIGMAFGFWLESSGLGSPRKLAAQLSFRDWTVFKVMFTALSVAAIAVHLAVWFELLDFALLRVNATFIWAILGGGALLGCGLALGGYCPGTSLAGLFSGRLDALFFILGMLLGVWGFAAVFDSLQPFSQAGALCSRATLDAFSGWAIEIILAIIATAAGLGYYLGSVLEKRGQGVIRAEDLKPPQ